MQTLSPPLPALATLAAHTLILEGPDALAFAQAQFASDVAALEPGRWQFSAWLDPKGRVRFLLQVARLGDDRLLVLLRGGEAAVLGDALRRFVFRAKVKILASPVLALIDAAALPMGEVNIVGDDIVLGAGDHAWRITAAPMHATQQWRALDIVAGFAWLPDATLDHFLPPSLSLERLQGVSFNKGCFPGQEIAARLHFRGGNKHHLHRVRLSDIASPGASLQDGETTVGSLLDVHVVDDMIEALAVIADSSLREDTHKLLQVVGTTITARSEHAFSV